MSITVRTEQLVDVEFDGGSARAIRGETEDEVLVSIRQCCRNLGLALAAQLRRINNTPHLAECLVEVVVRMPDESQARKHAFIRLHGLASWLSLINVKKVRPEIRERLIRYQRTCRDALAAYFGLVPARPTATAPPVAYDPQVGQALKMLAGLAAQLDDRIGAATAAIARVDADVTQVRAAAVRTDAVTDELVELVSAHTRQIAHIEAKLRAPPAVHRVEILHRAPAVVPTREAATNTRRTLAGVLKSSGADEGSDYSAVTNALYMGLLGKTAADIRREFSLPEKANVRKVLTDGERTLVDWAEREAAARIELDEARTLRDWTIIAWNAGAAARALHGRLALGLGDGVPTPQLEGAN